MKNKRLKLYDDVFKFCIDSETKERFRRASFSHNITPSDYIRRLISIALEYENIRRFFKDSSDNNYFIELTDYVVECLNKK